MKKHCSTLPLLVLMLLVGGCAVNNNYLRPADFADYLRRDGIEVTNVRTLLPDPFRASEGAAVTVAGSEVGVYKYDQTARVQVERLKGIAKSRRLYIIGIPYPVEVYGSFVFFGLDRNPAKRRILKTIRKFK